MLAFSMLRDRIVTENLKMLCFLLCPAFGQNCSMAHAYEMLCHNVECQVDALVTLNCTVFHSTVCSGDRTFFLEDVPCRYCYQIPSNQIVCDVLTDCEPGLGYFVTRCKSLVSCMGPSIFEKRTQCQRTGKSQKTAIFLSFFLGIFGADRFYLGHYVTAVFKLLTIGGLGIAYFIDIILIATGYLGPSGGGLYPERL